LGAVSFRGRFATCPEITSYEVAPLRLGPGETAQLSGTATDVDTDKLSYAWSAESGTVGDSNSANTTYQCNALGIITLTLVVSDGSCQDVVEAAVECFR
jgi:hypothetical protein